MAKDVDTLNAEVLSNCLNLAMPDKMRVEGVVVSHSTLIIVEGEPSIM